MISATLPEPHSTMASLPSRLLPQPHAGATAIFFDELDTGLFERGSDGVSARGSYKRSNTHLDVPV